MSVINGVASIFISLLISCISNTPKSKDTLEILSLLTDKFNGEFILRFRAKRHTTKNNHCYSFFAVIKCRSLSKKSNYNIEESIGQKFPPIKP